MGGVADWRLSIVDWPGVFIRPEGEPRRAGVRQGLQVPGSQVRKSLSLFFCSRPKGGQPSPALRAEKKRGSEALIQGLNSLATAVRPSGGEDPKGLSNCCLSIPNCRLKWNPRRRFQPTIDNALPH
jgi:hypothetical protein